MRKIVLFMILMVCSACAATSVKPGESTSPAASADPAAVARPTASASAKKASPAPWKSNPRPDSQYFVIEPDKVQEAELLYGAISANDIETTRKFLEAGINPDVAIAGDNEVRTGLKLAIGSKYNNIAKLLLDYGANPDFPWIYGFSNKMKDRTLYSAILSDNFEGAKLLIDYGAKVDSRIIRDIMNKGSKYIELLLQNGADKNLLSMDEVDELEPMSYLLSLGVKPSNISMLKPPVAGRRYKNLQSLGLIPLDVEMLAENEKKLHKELREECKNGTSEKLDGILGNLENKPYELNKCGEIAAASGNVAVLEHLKKSGMVFNDNIAKFAIASNNKKIDNVKAIKFLIDNNSKGIYKYLLSSEIIKSNPEIYKKLRENLPDLNSSYQPSDSSEYYSPLEIAAKANNKTLVWFLQEKGANINGMSWNGQTPLMFLPKYNNFEDFKWFIEKGADVNRIDINGRTALHYVAKMPNSITWAKLLVEKGAKIDAVDIDGMTPLMYSATNYMIRVNDYEHIVKHLINCGADLAIKNKNGKSARELGVNNAIITNIILASTADSKLESEQFLVLSNKQRRDFLKYITPIYENDLKAFNNVYDRTYRFEIPPFTSTSPDVDQKILEFFSSNLSTIVSSGFKTGIKLHDYPVQANYNIYIENIKFNSKNNAFQHSYLLSGNIYKNENILEIKVYNGFTGEIANTYNIPLGDLLSNFDGCKALELLSSLCWQMFKESLDYNPPKLWIVQGDKIIEVNDGTEIELAMEPFSFIFHRSNIRGKAPNNFQESFMITNAEVWPRIIFSRSNCEPNPYVSNNLLKLWHIPQNELLQEDYERAGGHDKYGNNDQDPGANFLFTTSDAKYENHSIKLLYYEKSNWTSLYPIGSMLDGTSFFKYDVKMFFEDSAANDIFKTKPPNKSYYFLMRQLAEHDKYIMSPTEFLRFKVNFK